MSATNDWHGANQAHLRASFERLRALLGAHLRREGAATELARADAALAACTAALPAPPAIERLAGAFALSVFEGELLLLCAGAELDAGLGELIAAAHGELGRPWPSMGLALAALPEAHWSAIVPAAPLRRWQLIEPAEGEGLAGAALRLDERVLHFLLGAPTLDSRLLPLLEPLEPPAALPPSQLMLARRLGAAWGGSPLPPAQLCGADRATRAAIAAAACAGLGLQLHALRARDLPAGAAEQDRLARLAEREAALGAVALLLELDDAETAAAAFVERFQGPIIVSGEQPLRGARRPLLRLDAAPPLPAEQQALWRGALGAHAERLNGGLDALAAQFTLGAAEIREVAAVAAPEPEALWEACRAQARLRLDDLAQRIVSAAGWDELVLPEQQRATLGEIAAHVRRRALVYEEWGFAARGQRGLGITALFAGVSGTGKTLAAEVLANELRLDLYRIDLSAVVSKYIGETEKNLRRIFDAAEAGGAILLFDEADALFGKRSEVKDSHDRYANLEVSYLLQRMEQYRGLAVLTTNMRQALDSAFLRRLRFVVQFPFPDAAQRAAIWRRIFPPGTPTAGLDPTKLARLNVAGGNIRSIALNAAFLAADAGEPVTMAHLLRAAHSEYAKLEKPLADAETRSWVEGRVAR